MAHPLLTVVLISPSGFELSSFAQFKSEADENRLILDMNTNPSYTPKRELYQPMIYVSVGDEYGLFTGLLSLPPKEKERWLHFRDFDQIKIKGLFNCWLSATDPLPANHSIRQKWTLSKYPVVSFFTTTYKSGDKILRPYKTLQKQTYPHWEWIIVDDSDDNGKTYDHISGKVIDSRIKKYRQEKHSGYIGLVKRCAARLCTGEILVELDHDDELTPDTCTRLIDAFRNNPNCGFAYAETSMVYEGTLKGEWYGWDFAFGYGTCWKQHIVQLNKNSIVTSTAELNWKTVRHLVGLPNHPRAWLRECYDMVGAHRPELSVSDDFDMLIRTILCTDLVKIPHMCYIQYINSGRNNYTFIRNREIQILCGQIEQYYREKINDRLRPLVPEISLDNYARIWTLPEFKFANSVDYSKKTSHIFVDPGIDQVDEMEEILEEPNTELVVVGSIIPPKIPLLANSYPDGSVRWWRMEIGTYEERVRYAKMITSTHPIDHVIHKPDRSAYPIKVKSILQVVNEMIRGVHLGYKTLLINSSDPIFDLEATEKKLREISGFEDVHLRESGELKYTPEPIADSFDETEEILKSLVFSKGLQDLVKQFKEDLDVNECHVLDLHLESSMIKKISQDTQVYEKYVEIALKNKYQSGIEKMDLKSKVIVFGSGILPKSDHKYMRYNGLEDHIRDCFGKCTPGLCRAFEYILACSTKGVYLGLEQSEFTQAVQMGSDRDTYLLIDVSKLHLPLRVYNDSLNGGSYSKEL